ncbi:hypothetical protein ACFB49_34430 [Sphingomonas sp. DBB INV C78]|uniref:Npun_F0296 family exosortase-dependent surface protein n=1 Tax=Sphingomonas sp. DBB INV C78 TaxID=3349434 RepID=UPI0036D2C91C
MSRVITGTLVSLFLGASAAHAATFVTSFAGAPDPGAIGTVLFDFETPVVAGQLGHGVTIAGEYQIYTGDAPPNAAAPAGDATAYLAVPGTSYSGFATLDFTGLTYGPGIGGFDFYWGSIDKGNRMAIVTSTGTYTFTGADIIGSGLGSTTTAQANRRVIFDLGPGEILQQIRFYSDLPAFELDDFAVVAVPEPSTWAMMLVGFLSIGSMLRRRDSARRGGVTMPKLTS